jgi:hypothetical protein
LVRAAFLKATNKNIADGPNYTNQHYLRPLYINSQDVSNNVTMVMKKFLLPMCRTEDRMIEN